MLNEVVWKTIREDYNKLCRLCKRLDDAISYIVLLSFAGNLFFILIQLFNSLRTMKNNSERVYFFVSFGFMILRTILVSLYGAWINDESKRPISVLNSVPTSVYNVEIRRFVQQISFDTVALTGKNFFSVTRGLILSVSNQQTNFANAILHMKFCKCNFANKAIKSVKKGFICRSQAQLSRTNWYWSNLTRTYWKTSMVIRRLTAIAFKRKILFKPKTNLTKPLRIKLPHNCCFSSALTRSNFL